MSALPYQLPIFRAEDATGASLPFALLYTYAAGTTTPLATYQDVAGTIPNSNPIVCDANGMAIVYMASGTAYKFVLEDQYGAIQPRYPQDNLIGGATGPAGPAGSTIRDGAGAPSNLIGIDGDYYLNDTNGDLYKRSSSVYAIVANSRGTAGIGVAVGAVASGKKSGAGTASSSTTLLMGGYGSKIQITTIYSTRVRLSISCFIQNDTPNATTGFVVCYGTGTPPVSGTTAPGTGNIITDPSGGGGQIEAESTSSTANALSTATIDYILTGLTPGVLYWFDVAVHTGGIGTGAISNPSYTIFEI